MNGVILKSTGSWYDVLGTDDKMYACRIRGKLRLDEIKESNPVTVGDQVEFDVAEGSHSITQILNRKNYMLRQSVKKTGHASILAANIDQAILIATLKLPRTSMGFIDRFFVSAESFRIPQVLIFNKEDTLNGKEQQEMEDILRLYQSIGIHAIHLSALHSDLDHFIEILQGKVSLIAGHSGVGKSTLINRLSDAISQRTSEISNFSNKGIHTTTFATMFPLNPHTYIIDTPGVKEWGLVNMDPQEISDYFPEMREVRLQCKFGARCLHQSEPSCAVIKALLEGTISKSRYNSYLSMVQGRDNRK